MLSFFSKLKNKKGFTLVELMVVVAIIGILVAIAVPVYKASTDKANDSAKESNVRIIEGALAMYHAQSTTASALNIASDASDATNPLVPEFIKKWPSGPNGTKYSVVSDVVTVIP